MLFKPATIAALAALVQITLAYGDNCSGSNFFPNIGSCITAINKVDPGSTIADQQELSFDDCYMKYATNGSGPQPVSGRTIKDIALRILEVCNGGHGSFGTGNCDECHVTLNYRKP